MPAPMESQHFGVAGMHHSKSQTPMENGPGLSLCVPAVENGDFPASHVISLLEGP